MKKRFIACIIACALLLMGTGYAYWTDLFRITGSVNTGYFEVKLTEVNKGLLAITDGDEYPLDLTSSYSDASASATKIRDDGHAVTVSVSKMYPGYAQKFNFKAENYGTVAAKLTQIYLDKSNIPEDLLDVIGISLKVTMKGALYFLNPKSGEVVDIPVNNPDFRIRNESFVSLRNINNINIKSKTLLLDVKNLPDPEMEIELVIGMNPDAIGNYTSGTWLNGSVNSDLDGKTQDSTGDFTLEFRWDQYNAHRANN